MINLLYYDLRLWQLSVYFNILVLLVTFCFVFFFVNNLQTVLCKLATFVIQANNKSLKIKRNIRAFYSNVTTEGRTQWRTGMGTSGEGQNWEDLTIVMLPNILHYERPARLFITEIRCFSSTLGHLSSMSYFFEIFTSNMYSNSSIS